MSLPWRAEALDTDGASKMIKRDISEKKVGSMRLEPETTAMYKNNARRTGLLVKALKGFRRAAS